MKKKIIVAEDNDDILYLMVAALQNNGYEVIGLKDGSAIMEGLCAWPDLFILDKDMGQYDGLTISKFVRSRSEGNSIAVMMVSGSATPEQAFREAGVNVFLAKPIHTEELLRSVNQMLA